MKKISSTLAIFAALSFNVAPALAVEKELEVNNQSNWQPESGQVTKLTNSTSVFYYRFCYLTSELFIACL